MDRNAENMKGLRAHMADITVIGVAGGTGSGKTTITNSIAERFGDEVTVISQDSYYRAHHDMPFEERTKLNYDHPDAFENELLIAQLKELKAGHAIEEPVYDFAKHDRSSETVTVTPSRVIVVEGILIFCDPALRDLMDIKVYVDTDRYGCRRQDSAPHPARCGGARAQPLLCHRPVPHDREADA